MMPPKMQNDYLIFILFKIMIAILDNFILFLIKLSLLISFCIIALLFCFISLSIVIVLLTIAITIVVTLSFFEAIAISFPLFSLSLLRFKKRGNYQLDIKIDRFVPVFEQEQARFFYSFRGDQHLTRVKQSLPGITGWSKNSF